LRGIGQDELGCKEIRFSHELDPLNTTTTDAWAECLFETGHFNEAVRMVKDILEIDPDNLASRWTLGEIYERQRMFPEAVEQYQKGMEITHGKEFIPYALLGSAYAASGQTDRAEEILHEMNVKFGEDKWLSAGIHVRMGRTELAIRELTDDVAKCGPGSCGPGSSLYISERRFDPLHGDPRFQTLLKRFNYPESAFRK
jgi:tetratricopeptide (TPR) repeat protein